MIHSVCLGSAALEASLVSALEEVSYPFLKLFGFSLYPFLGDFKKEQLTDNILPKPRVT